MTSSHRITRLAALALGLWLCAPVALACPNCTTARTVRAAVWDDTFWNMLCLLVLPLVVIAAISSALYAWGDPTGRARAVEKETP